MFFYLFNKADVIVHNRNINCILAHGYDTAFYHGCEESITCGFIDSKCDDAKKGHLRTIYSILVFQSIGYFAYSNHQVYTDWISSSVSDYIFLAIYISFNHTKPL